MDNKSKKKKLIALLLILLLAILLILGVYFLFFKNKGGVLGLDSEGTVKTGELVVVKDGVSVEREGRSFIVGTEQTDVKSGDVVKTDKSGTAYILFSDNSSITLDKSTTVTIDTQNDKSDSFKTRIIQSAGRTWSRVERIFGKKADYNVETPSTIAAVRGTQFGCDVSKNTSCYAIEHSIYLNLKNDNGNEFILDEGSAFTNEGENPKDNAKNFKKLNDYFGSDDKEWEDFNICLTDKARNIIGDENNQLDLLKTKDIVGPCEGKLNPTAVVLKPKAKPSNVKVSLGFNGSIYCNWSGTNTNQYDVYLEDQSGNIVSKLLSTFKTSNTFTSAALKSETWYYCWVRGYGNGLATSFVKSNGYFYDSSSATVRYGNIPRFSVKTGRITGLGTFANMAFSHLKFKFYLINNNKVLPPLGVANPNYNKYLSSPAGTWSTGLVWLYNLVPANTGGGTFSAQSSYLAIPTGKYVIRIVFYNSYTGKIFGDTGNMNITAI